MITLIELINATTWLQPQDHIRITLWDKTKAYEDENEFKDIDLDVYNLAKYGNCYISDIDIEIRDDESYLCCLVWKD